MLIADLALVSAALFTGAAFYGQFCRTAAAGLNAASKTDEVKGSSGNPGPIYLEHSSLAVKGSYSFL